MICARSKTLPGKEALAIRLSQPLRYVESAYSNTGDEYGNTRCTDANEYPMTEAPGTMVQNLVESIDYLISDRTNKLAAAMTKRKIENSGSTGLIEAKLLAHRNGKFDKFWTGDSTDGGRLSVVTAVTKFEVLHDVQPSIIDKSERGNDVKGTKFEMILPLTFETTLVVAIKHFSNSTQATLRHRVELKAPGMIAGVFTKSSLVPTKIQVILDTNFLFECMTTQVQHMVRKIITHAMISSPSKNCKRSQSKTTAPKKSSSQSALPPFDSNMNIAINLPRRAADEKIISQRSFHPEPRMARKCPSLKTDARPDILLQVRHVYEKL